MATFVIVLVLASYISAIAGLGLIFQPQAVISRLETTMIIPEIPKGPGIHYVWPGLQPDTNNFVFQDVSGDELGTGAWTFAEWAVSSSGDYNKTDNIAVYPGDSIAICFAMNTMTGRWTDRWVTSPGTAGTAAGEAYMISDYVAPEDQATAYGALTQALFVIELIDATWNFGQLAFEKIRIVAQTTQIDWCAHPNKQGSFVYSMTTPKVSAVGNLTVCSIDSLVFLNPI